METFLQALTFNSTVSSLKVFHNYTSDRDKKYFFLAQALRVNSSLSSLDLSDNSISDEGANSLAQALSLE